jgi:hypothetical protein
MTPIDRGPLQTYRVNYKDTKQYEDFLAHQVLVPPAGWFGDKSPRDDFFLLHGEIDGKWQLVLAIHADKVESIQNITSQIDDALTLVRNHLRDPAPRDSWLSNKYRDGWNDAMTRIEEIAKTV